MRRWGRCSRRFAGRSTRGLDPIPTLDALVGAIVLAGLPSLGYVLLLNAIDRFEKEPLRTIALSFALGAVATPVLTVAVLALTGRSPELPLGYAPGTTPDPVARIIEQLIACGLVLGLARAIGNEFDDGLDGIVYGGAVGAGLGAAETFLFVVGGTGQLGGTTVGLLLVAGLNQAFYGAAFGAIAGAMWRRQPGREAWLVIALGVATVAFLSAFHDTLPAILSRVVQRPDAAIGAVTRSIAFLINVLGIAGLGIAIWAAWHREARIVRGYLASEVAAGEITLEEVGRLGSFRSRIGGQLAVLRSGGFRELQARRNLEAAMGELAFHNWRTAVRSRPPDSRTGDTLRARIRSLRAELGRAHPGGRRP